MATQTLEEITDRQLKHILLSNTAVKIIGTNGMQTQRALAQLTGIPSASLERLKKFQFIVKAGEEQPVVAKTSGILTRAKSLYMNRHEIR